MNTEQHIAAQTNSPTPLGAWLRAVEGSPLTADGLDRLLADLEEEEDGERFGFEWQ